ncbi:Response regulator MprA [Roseimaritima multifibrata]|uniref:Response regulator MprA n=1 Tax=Roseimaritima multifibrata TaxID=1930274 RepID=A0A517MGY9_9BACT|nr:response regulator [Roseimaritima multifibrata]QDS94148.1 Response regulator MprA [Roseimaritima multifibrata]
MSKRLLFAESDSTLAEIYSRYYSNHGYEVDTAQDVMECLEKLHKTDVLILELGLPRFGEYGADDVLSHIRTHSQISDIPVVLVTSENSREWLSRLAVPPVVECLQKPFRLAALLDVVRVASRSQFYPACSRVGFSAATVG